MSNVLLSIKYTSHSWQFQGSVSHLLGVTRPQILISIRVSVSALCNKVQAGMFVYSTATACLKIWKDQKVLNVADCHVSFDILCTYVGVT